MKIENFLREKFVAYFSPVFLELENESNQHNVPPGSESHFKTIIVTEKFEGLNRVKRHQEVYKAAGELMQKIHALAIHTFTKAEWENSELNLQSPKCRGGENAKE